MAYATPGKWIRVTAVLCAALLARGEAAVDAALPEQAQSPLPGPAAQLDSLVAPIALYPDPLLAQVLTASTYPLEIVQLQQWLTKHEYLKDKDLADAVQQEDWDPSIQVLAALPEVVTKLVDNIKWTSELGNAFLAQQSDVMEAVQRLRAKAKDTGKLQSSQQVKVETKVVESKTVVVIQQANPQVIYVPSYNPVVVWGAPPIYAYPPIYYPAPAYYAAGMAISFGAGIAMGAFWSGGWGWHCGWGAHNTVNVNVNNNFYRHTNINRTNVTSGDTNWTHNPRHRGGAPYGDRATASKYGGTARGDSLSTRQSQDQLAAGQQPGVSNRAVGTSSSLGTNRSAGDASNLSANRSASSVGTVGVNCDGTGSDRIGNRQVPGDGGSRGAAAFGSAGTTRGSAALSSGARGASSLEAQGWKHPAVASACEPSSIQQNPCFRGSK